MRCPVCHAQCADLGKHYGHSRACSIASEKAPEPRAPPTNKLGVEADSHFKKKFERRINLDYANLRYKRFIDTSHLDAFHHHAIEWIELLFDAVVDAAASATCISEAVPNIRRVFSEGRAVLVKYQSEAMRDAYLIKTLKMPYIEPVPYTEDIDEFRKFAAKLSLREVVGRILQHDAQARKLIKAKSDEWMKGEKHMIKSDIYTDITDGWRCRSHEHLMRKATADEISENVIRIGIGVHNDDVTFANPIGTKRGEHKDSITDASIINLPLNKRHSFEYIMLLSVVNSKTLKARGGVEWSFCGVNEKGKETVKDSLAAEFRACSFSIKLPNDADPTGDDISHRVELYAMLAHCAPAALAAARPPPRPPPRPLRPPREPSLSAGVLQGIRRLAHVHAVGHGGRRGSHSLTLTHPTGTSSSLRVTGSLRQRWATPRSRRQQPIRAQNACGFQRLLASGAETSTTSLHGHALMLTSLRQLHASQQRVSRRQRSESRWPWRASILSPVCCSLTGSQARIRCVINRRTSCTSSARASSARKQRSHSRFSSSLAAKNAKVLRSTMHGPS